MAISDAQQSVPRVSLAPETRWDEMFPTEPAFLRQQHRDMVAALHGAGITVENVEVRSANYFWRYDVCRDGAHAALRINFRRNGTITPQVLPIAGSDVTLGQEILPILRVAPLPAQPQSEPLEFPDDKPFLHAFYDDCMRPKAETIGARIVRIDHHQFLEKYHLTKGSSSAVITAYYNARGTITSIVHDTGDEGLYREIMDAS